MQELFEFHSKRSPNIILFESILNNNKINLFYPKCIIIHFVDEIVFFFSYIAIVDEYVKH